MDDTTFLIELQNISNKLNNYAMYLTQGRTEDAHELFQATVVRAYIKRNISLPAHYSTFGLSELCETFFLTNVSRRSEEPE